MVSGTACDDAVRFFLVSELTYFIIGTSELEASGFLKVLSLEIKLAFVRELSSFDEICFSCNIFQYECCVIYFVECKHMFFSCK